MKVFAVMSYNYDEPKMEGVFSTPELAQEAAAGAEQRRHCYIEECVIDIPVT